MIILFSWFIVGTLVFLSLVYDWFKYRRHDGYPFGKYLAVHAEESIIITIVWPLVVIWMIFLVIAAWWDG